MLAKSPPKHFAAIPLQAIGDKQFCLLSRALALIAWHDRLGDGCWQKRKSMAERLRCNEASLSRAINHLVRCGYLKRIVHPTIKTRRIYTVVYENRLQIGNQIGDLSKSQPTEDKGERRSNRTSNRTKESLSLRDSALRKRSDASKLAIFEKRLKQGKCSEGETEEGFRICREVFENNGPSDSSWQRAVRLLAEVDP